MKSQDEKSKQISLLQDNLQTIRKIAGWTIEELGEKIGVTKQTISNLERNKTKMNLTQYIAIRSVLDYEINENPQNEVLPKAIDLLLDSGSNLSKEDYKKIRDLIEAIAAAASGGLEEDKLSTLFSSTVGTVLVGAGISLMTPMGVLGGAAVSLWIRKLFDNK